MAGTDPKQVLREARLLVKSHQYAAALERYIWFHEHALDSDMRMSGVRLSYAVSEWAELGKVYAPARIKLEGVRDAKTDAVINGTQDAHLFHDVAAINRALEQSERTSELFRIVADGDREIAEKCFRVALEALIDTKDYALARSFLPDPQKEIDQFAIPFNFPSQGKTDHAEMFQDTLVRIYVKRVNLILQAFIGTGDERMASDLRNYALEHVPDAHIREKVADRLFPSPVSKRIQ